jgi:hypothetical protein
MSKSKEFTSVVYLISDNSDHGPYIRIPGRGFDTAIKYLSSEALAGQLSATV